MKIHVSPDTKSLLEKHDTFELDVRGPVEMKGKGTITTYWLLGEKDPDQKSFARSENVSIIFVAVNPYDSTHKTYFQS